MLRCNPRNWDFDIDRFLNPFVPPPPWKYLPYPISHFFGYRKSKPQNVGNLVSIFWACVGVFCGVAVVSIVSRQIPSFRDHGAPIIVGSFVSISPLSSRNLRTLPVSTPSTHRKLLRSSTVRGWWVIEARTSTPSSRFINLSGDDTDRPLPHQHTGTSPAKK